MAKARNLPLDKDTFGALLPFVTNDNVTDINYHDGKLWIEDLEEGSYLAEGVVLDKEFLNKFCVRVSNLVSANFNEQEKVVEADTDTLRFSIIHDSATAGDMAISIRQSSERPRLTGEKMIASGYCTSEMLVFLINCVKAHLNIVICGLPGCGKTELIRLLMQYFVKTEKVVTIEDTFELKYTDVCPDSNGLPLKVSDNFSYTDALKAVLRQFPAWVLLSEIRSIEVVHFIESLTSGINGMSTTHTDDVRKIPDRFMNLMKNDFDASRLKNDIYTSVNIGVLLRKKQDKMTGKVTRFIDQICIFDRDDENNKNTCTMVVENRKVCQGYQVPKNIQTKFDWYLK